MLNDISQVGAAAGQAAIMLQVYTVLNKQVATWAKLNGGMIKMFEAEVTAAAQSLGVMARAAVMCHRRRAHVTSRHAPCRCCSSSPSFSTFCSGPCCRRLTGRRSSSRLQKLRNSLRRCIIFVKLTRAPLCCMHARGGTIPSPTCCTVVGAAKRLPPLQPVQHASARLSSCGRALEASTTVSSSPQSRRTRAGRSRSCTRFWA
jgi:hypothetical protein